MAVNAENKPPKTRPKRSGMIYLLIPKLSRPIHFNQTADLMKSTAMLSRMPTNLIIIPFSPPRLPNQSKTSQFSNSKFSNINNMISTSFQLRLTSFNAAYCLHCLTWTMISNSTITPIYDSHQLLQRFPNVLKLFQTFSLTFPNWFLFKPIMQTFQTASPLESCPTDKRNRSAEIDRRAAEQRVDRESAKDDVRVLPLASGWNPSDYNRANLSEHEHRAPISGLQLASASAVGEQSDHSGARRHFDIGKRRISDRRTGGRHVN